MTLLEKFNICCSGGYNNTSDYVSWKVIDDIMYFQCSRENEDWLKNIDIRLTKTDIGMTHKGFDDAFRSISRMIMQTPINEYVGYSHGSTIAARASSLTRRPAVVFGCPNFMFNPSKQTLDRFDNVQFVQNKGDIVADWIFWLKKGRNKVYTKGSADMAGVPKLETLSHHSPTEYRQKLRGNYV